MRRQAVMLLVLLLLVATSCGQQRSSSEVPTVLEVVLNHGNNSRPYMPWPEELAKQVRAAARLLGDARLVQTVDSLLVSIKRDVIAAPSLYFDTVESSSVSYS